MKREIVETTESLIHDGEVNFGWFRTPFRNLNILDCDFPGPGGRSPKQLRAFMLKEWQHFAVMHEEMYISVALVDVKYLSKSWVCMFDRRSANTLEHSREALLKRIGPPRELLNASFNYKGLGYFVEVANRLDSGYHTLVFDIEQDGELPSVKGELRLDQPIDEIHPLISVLPIGDNRPFYSHKSPCQVSGSLRVGDRELNFDKKRDLALIDVHKAYYPRRTFWKWATFATRDESGNLIGLNLTHNVIDDEKYGNENAIWYKDSLSLVGPARFEVPFEDGDAWRIRTLDDRVDLEFVPEGMRTEHLNYIVARSHYRQPFGRYRGFMKDDAGVKHAVDDVFGIAEDHYVVW